MGRLANGACILMHRKQASAAGSTSNSNQKGLLLKQQPLKDRFRLKPWSVQSVGQHQMVNVISNLIQCTQVGYQLSDRRTSLTCQSHLMVTNKCCCKTLRTGLDHIDQQCSVMKRFCELRRSKETFTIQASSKRNFKRCVIILPFLLNVLNTLSIWT